MATQYRMSYQSRLMVRHDNIEFLKYLWCISPYGFFILTNTNDTKHI